MSTARLIFSPNLIIEVDLCRHMSDHTFIHQDEITRWRDAVFITQTIIANKGDTSYIEALDLDALSNPPPERLPKPGECLKSLLSE
jgi:hypothetical protein